MLLTFSGYYQTHNHKVNYFYCIISINNMAKISMLKETEL